MDYHSIPNKEETFERRMGRAKTVTSIGGGVGAMNLDFGKKGRKMPDLKAHRSSSKEVGSANKAFVPKFTFGTSEDLASSSQ